MKTNTICILVSSFLFFTTFTSCLSGKKASVLKVLTESKELLNAEEKRVNTIKENKTNALSEERIDTTILNRINIRMHSFQIKIDSASSSISYLEKMLSDNKLFRKNYKTSVIKNTLWLINNNQKAYINSLKQNMILNAIENADKKLYNLAAFFGPGKYIIPTEQIDLASTSFKPLMDSLVLFTNKYDTITSTATIVVNGFADGTGISTGSELFQTLSNYLKKESATKEELNQALSELRAIEISKLLDIIFERNKSSFSAPHNVKFLFYGNGQGETFPTKAITDYQDDDERRRIVLIYWIVLPE
jgi:hypothetical protein